MGDCRHFHAAPLDQDRMGITMDDSQAKLHESWMQRERLRQALEMAKPLPGGLPIEAEISKQIYSQQQTAAIMFNLYYQVRKELFVVWGLWRPDLVDMLISNVSRSQISLLHT